MFGIVDDEAPKTDPEGGLAPKVLCPNGLEKAAPVPKPEGDPNDGLPPKAGAPPNEGPPPNADDARPIKENKRVMYVQCVPYSLALLPLA